MQLSKNFTLAELTKSGVALRYCIDNTPSGEEIANLELLAMNSLQTVRDHDGLPFSPSSGYRSAEVNRIVGSKYTSQHRRGQAADIEVPGVSNRDLAEWIKENLDFDQMILEYHKVADPSSGWIHCSYIKQGNRNQCLIFNGTHYREF